MKLNSVYDKVNIKLLTPYCGYYTASLYDRW